MTHPWKSRGDKRTISFYYDPSDRITEYLNDMMELVNKAVLNAYSIARSDHNELPSPITLRRSLKRYYDDNMDYAKHHINPVCRSALAILRSYKKNNNGSLTIVQAKRLSMRIDSELTRIENNRLRITIRPNEYEYIPIVTKNKKYNEYSKS